jgi:hypothetical protein
MKQEEVATEAALLQLLDNRQIQDVRWGPAYSTGTRIWVKYSGVWRAFLVSDLTAPERIVGQVSCTIGLNIAESSTAVTIAPALKDSTLSNYRLFAFIDSGVSSGVVVSRFALSSVSAGTMRLARTANAQTAGAALTGVTVGAGDLTDINTITNTTHGADAGFAGHGHTVTGHPVTDPQHSHVIFTWGAVTVNVDYLIWHV